MLLDEMTNEEIFKSYHKLHTQQMKKVSELEKLNSELKRYQAELNHRFINLGLDKDQNGRFINEYEEKLLDKKIELEFNRLNYEYNALLAKAEEQGVNLDDE